MKNLYEIFEIRRAELSDDSDFIEIEDCSLFDSALNGFYVACLKSNLSSVLQWIDDNCKSISDYVKQNFKVKKYVFALNLVKSTKGIKLFTEEFVKAEGSIQGFLDRYGRNESDIQFNGIAELTEEEKSYISELSFEADIGSEDKTMSDIPNCLSDFTPEDVIDKVDETIEEVETEAEVESKSKSEVILENESLPEFEALPEPESDPNKPLAGISYDIECSGVGIDGIAFKDGKFVVPFNELSNLVTSIMSAGNIIEKDAVKGLRLLTTSNKVQAAQVVERYSPTVIKDFILKYILDAETDVDFIRITTLLNQFCNYLGTNKIKEM